MYNTANKGIQIIQCLGPPDVPLTVRQFPIL